VNDLRGNSLILRRIALLVLGLGVTFLSQASESIATWNVVVPPKPGSVRCYCEDSSDLVWQVALKRATEATHLTSE
jgi:hypothetical protein